LLFEIGWSVRTLIIILIGFAVWAVCLGIAKFIANASAASVNIATAIFVVIWLLAAAGNMWMGVTQAGYAFRDELPIFLLIFLVPVATAILVKWKFF
jgi:hypothetical protein